MSKAWPILPRTSRILRTSTTRTRAVPHRHARQRCSSCRSASRCELRIVKVEKSSLVAMLLEVGEENAAVLLARSPLPDELDTERELNPVGQFGLERDQVEELARLSIGGIQPDDVTTRRRRGELEKTISRRWADLVDQWLS